MPHMNLNIFLENHKWDKNKNKLTHTRIGDKDMGIYGGSYSIEEDDLNEFYSLYYKHIFVNKKNEYLTEIQDRVNGGPILIDLDFRYDTDVKKRKHDKTTISDIVSLYADNLNKMLNFTEKKDTINFDVYVFHKDNINILNNLVKDGIHIIIGLHMNHIQQQMLRNMLLEKSNDSNQPILMYECLNDLKLINSCDDILDEGITKGQTGWQMYGSGKPGHECYKLTDKYNVVINKVDSDKSYDDGIDITEEEIPKIDINLLKILSAKNKNFEQFNLNPCYQEMYEKIKKNKVKKIKNVKIKKSSNKMVNNSNINDFISNMTISNIINNIRSENDLNLVIEKFIIDCEAKII